MRVLHVVECYAGGVGRAVDTLASVTPEIEHHLLYAGSDTPGPGLWQSTCELPDGFRARLIAARRLVDELRPDVVHAHSSWAGVYTRLRRPRVPLVYQPHCFKFADSGLTPARRTFYKAAEALLARHTSIVAAVSPSELDLARRLHGPARLVLLPNAPIVAIGEGHGAALRRQVAMAGRISAQKEPELFADVARRCTDAGIDARFVWIGDGDRSDRSRLEGSGVEVTGWLSPAELAEELDRTSVYLHTARYEGFPLSVLDAAARHVPMVLRDIPAFAGSGLTVVPDARLVERVATLLDDDDARKLAVTQGDRVVATMNRNSLAKGARDAYGGLTSGADRAA